MNVSELAVRRPVATVMLFTAVVLVGYFSFNQLKVDFLPDVDYPSLSVVTGYSGVGPEEIENLITRPIEQAVSAVQGVESVESYSSEGRSRVTLRFNWGIDLDGAMNDVRAFVERVKRVLPEDADAPIVYKFDLGSFPIMFLSVGGELEPAELRRVAEDVLRYRLERIEGVAAVDLRGGQRREILVELFPDALANYGIGAAEVVEALRRENMNTPAGQVHDGSRNLLLRAMGEFSTLADIEDLIVRPARPSLTNPSASQGPVHLQQLGRVREVDEEASSIVRVNGQPGIRLSLSKQAGANTVAVAQAVRAELARINAEYDGRVHVGVLFDSSTFIETAIQNVKGALGLGAGLAVLVLLLFLRSVRSTLVISLAIPISIIGTFTLMHLFDITLNIVSFGGIALGLGMLVDNSIVILENIYRHHENGETPVEAAIKGSREVSGAVIASTLTTLAVFVPVIFMGGFAAVFFQQMAFVVSFTLMCSLAVALTLVPMLATLAMRGKRQKRRFDPMGRVLEGMDRTYAWVTKRVIRHGFIAAIILLGVCVASGMQFKNVGREFMPEEDQGELRVSINMPPGTRVEVTLEAALQAEAIVRAMPEVQDVLTTAGASSMWSSRGESSASLRIGLVESDQRERSSEEMADDVRTQLEGLIPGARVSVRASSGTLGWLFGGSGDGERLEVELRGYDREVAMRFGERLATVMREIDGVADAEMKIDEGGDEARVYVDPDVAARVGLSPAMVGRVLEIYVKGVVAGFVRAGGEELPIRVRLSDDSRGDLETILSAPVVLSNGRHMQLGGLTRTEPATTPRTIYRENQERVLSVAGGLTGERDLGSITEDVRAALREMTFPEGFAAVVAGESAEQDKTFASLALGLLLAIALVYMVMAGQFESFLNPFIIMLAAPLSVTGAILTLSLTHTTLNVNSFMGMIVLSGVVVNNAIVLIDYITLLRRDYGMSRHDAIIEGARRRLRPILMTTLTTCLALLPIAVEAGEGAQTQAPLARVVCGGLIFSLLITLFLIPVIYNFVSAIRERIGRRFRRGATQAVLEGDPNAA